MVAGGTEGVIATFAVLAVAAAHAPVAADAARKAGAGASRDFTRLRFRVDDSAELVGWGIHRDRAISPASAPHRNEKSRLNRAAMTRFV